MGDACEKFADSEEVFDDIDMPLVDDGEIEVLPTDDDEEAEGQHLRFRVGTNLKFRRLDKYLCGRFNHFSRSRLQKLIKEQGVNVNGQPAKPSHKLNPRDEIDLILPRREVREIVPEDIPLDIVYEDDDVIVVNKQANLIVHPARGYKSGTLVNGLVYHANSLSAGSDEYRPGIVHRLDKNTTGVIIVAKTDHAHWKISRQFAERTTQKTYLAIVHGVPELTGDCINLPMGTHPHQREKCAIRADGKEAITFYQVLEAFRGFALVKLSPKTGRTHQLRVHMTHLKHPIVADDMYGGKLVYDWQIEDRDADVAEPIIDRPALHAWRLEIKHPSTNQPMTFEAPLAPDMQALLEKLRQFRRT